LASIPLNLENAHMKLQLLTAGVFAALLTASPVIAQTSGSDNTAKPYAPGQQESGTAKQHAPGQQKTEGSAKKYAPGQVKKEDDTATKQKGSNETSGATGATKKGKVENTQ
jgi:hypothetical protein